MRTRFDATVVSAARTARRHCLKTRETHYVPKLEPASRSLTLNVGSWSGGGLRILHLLGRKPFENVSADRPALDLKIR
ncbi:unnamed protein product [Boreogadus saida]